MSASLASSSATPRVAVIAGVGPGLGAALAQRFAAGGARVALLARTADYLDTLAGELTAAHGPGRTPCLTPCSTSLTRPGTTPSSAGAART